METNNSSSPSEGQPKQSPVNTSTSNKPTGTKKKRKDDQKKINHIDTYIKVAGPVLTAIGLILGAWQFQYQQGANDEQEFKRRIWEKRLDAYMTIGELTGKLIATPAPSRQFDSLQHHFEQLYWGKMPLFENDSIAYRMKLVSEELQMLQMQQGYKSVLKQRSLLLMQTCQQSLYDSWKNIEDKKPKTNNRPNTN
ncbi:hypothetical protein EXU85_03690 [Spirosoma sp. KCTC 42546]|uniref:hypothetical protein n=1 Tax=Spirosoma sp. KCTC 42546 TaxID=2520506 RepID=UPI00115AC8A5|nr:hypothetical protein [Spirosoma sp. KCTC 42546]QDK77744.1 hypothetical protein EXU85_03690 [Spirosoma sp. KCTC 42546]